MRLVEFLAFGLSMAVIGAVCYLPFFLNFASQASGILPSVIYATRGVDFWVMFTPFLVPIFAFLVRQNIRAGKGKGLRIAGRVTGIVLISLAALSTLLAVAASMLGDLGDLFMWNLGASGASIWAVLWEALRRRLVQPGAWLTLGTMLILGLAILIKTAKQEKELPANTPSREDGFIALLIVWGVLLTLVPEFIYLLDGFGTRMNTIFKFYFQVWLLWSIAGAYGIATLWQDRSAEMARKDRLWLLGMTALSIAILLVTCLVPVMRVEPVSDQIRFGTYLLDWLWAAWGIVTLFGLVWMGIRRRWRDIVLVFCIAGITAGLIYPALAIPDRANGFRHPENWTLDGRAVYGERDPDLLPAVDWLQTAEEGILAEAVGPEGGDFSQYGRVSMLTGLQSVLGWRNHEVQWRGGSEEIGSRQEDVAVLYETTDWENAKEVIGMYNIRYIYLGNLERTTYDVQEDKFEQHLAPVFDRGTVRIYQFISE
jgi:uncharacterized membrane protein